MKIDQLDVYIVKLDHHYRLRGVDETPNRLPGSNYFFEPHWRQAYSRKLETCLIKITTDSGLSGWGEAQSPLLPEAAGSVIKGLFGPFLLGKDPLAHALIYDQLYHMNNVRGHSSGFTVDAIAGLDIALWDIAGKHFGVPIYQLMGGPFRRELTAYVSGLRQPTLEAQCEAAKNFIAQGFEGIKLFLGHGVETDGEVLRGIRAAAGSRTQLMCDLLWRYGESDARRIGRILDAEGYTWLEAPVAPEDVASHRRLAQALDTAIAVGETLRTPFEFQAWFSTEALGVAQPDIMRTGLSGALKIATLAQTQHIPIAPHVGVSTGIGIAASWQFSAAVPNFLIQEYQHDLMPSANSILMTPLHARDGKLQISERPGLGIGVNETAVLATTTEHWSLREK